jgi:pimeloyl-ACP methyl ester carboxylesterase
MAKLDGITKGAIYCHGTGGVAQSLWDSTLPGQLALGKLLSSRYWVCSADWSFAAWGNDQSLGDTLTGSAIMDASGCSTAGKILVGGSMGTTQVLRYAAKNPTKVRGVGLFIPAINTQEVRANVPSAATAIEAAFGITSIQPLPTLTPDANPINLAGSIQCPVFIAYASNDPLVYAATAEAFIADLISHDVDVTVVNVGALGHSEAAILAGVGPFDTWLSQKFPQDIR